MALLADPAMPQAELAGWMAATTEGPAALVGIPADQMARIVADAAARLSDPIKLQAVAEHEAAAELARVALDYAMGELANATGLQPAAFVAWAISEGAPAEAFDPALVEAADRQGAAVVAKAGGAV
ncbi:hypothetical protein SAMN05444370_1501 [Rubrimonas cliftonensis]|uniref:Uncharacterized protein n=2 Tax=Rubrimonas cliftonensis TaxID=89524 RepID=A0A1H4GE37_9RHOB|nr:hypothetical protein SAMN05444370_1501 [Rubrimonas cliftonensis]